MNFTFCKLFFAKNYKNLHFFKKNLILKRTKCPPKAFIFQKKRKTDDKQGRHTKSI